MSKNIVRFGVSIDSKLLKVFDSIIDEKGYINRSEAIRDLIRDMLGTQEIEDPNTIAIGTLTLVYNHHIRELSDKLNDVQHHYFKNIISATHIHLDEENCLEVLIIKGETSILKELSDKILSIKNIKLGKLSLTSIDSNI